MNDGQIVFEISADGRQAIANIREITDAIRRESGQWQNDSDRAANHMAHSFSNAFKSIASAIGAAKIGQSLVNIAKEAIDAASDLAEVQNVVDVTFGESGARKIQDWANEAGKQFGLTETQAKQFTSTLGAMMKSAGLAGPEIVNMSTDLAGLAADMASFYNLDFDTAFQKIRSGISGETEPLKQLGINMSVANLEAYALSKGITKAFDKMSQGEQTMLRYQYLMQATADAQGDFARTSDGYANSLRQFETNIESLKTQLGTILIPIANDAVNALNDIIEKVSPTTGKTIMDQIADVELNTDKRIQEIGETADIARALIAELETIESYRSSDALGRIATDLSSISLDQGKTQIVKDFLEVLNRNITEISAVTGKDSAGVQSWLSDIADKANKLESGKSDDWESLVALIRGGLPDLENTNAGKTLLDTLLGIQNTKAGGAVQELAEELGKIDTTQGNIAIVKDTLETLSSNITTLSSITGKDAEGVKKWLAEVSEEAGKLGPDDVAGWTTIADMIKNGIPGIEDTEGGSSVLHALAQEVGDETDEVNDYLRALGIESDDVANRQALWLEICQRLVKTIPGLASIVDTTTGSVTGGVKALQDYIDQWEMVETRAALLQEISKEKELLSEKYGDRFKLHVDTIEAQARVDALQKKLDSFDQTVKNVAEEENKAARENPLSFFVGMSEQTKEYNKTTQDLTAAKEELAAAQKKYNDYMADYQAALNHVQEREEAVMEATDGMTDAFDDSAKSADTWSQDMVTAATSASEGAQQALTALSQHVAEVRKSVQKSVDKVVGGFDPMISKSQKAETKVSELIKQQQALGKRTEKNAKQWDNLTQRINEYNSQVVTPKSMKDSLDSQLAFMDEYIKNLDKAKEMGISDELLAELSDGSLESADYLSALVSDPEIAAQINEQYKEVQKKKEEFVSALTNQQLTTDTVYEELAQKAKEAVAALDLQGEAATNSGLTIAAMAESIRSHVPDVSSAVDAIISELNRLDGWGINIDLGLFGSLGISAGKAVDGEHETGLNYVPFDGYLAQLHEGEGVLTAEENRIWQRFKAGDISNRNVDYDALGGVMRDNVRAGGNVYLDGRIVGGVISDIQAKSYRSLMRSGWQA